MKNKNIPILIFMVASFIILPIISLPFLAHIGQVDRFSFILGGYWGFAIQMLAMRFREVRIWRIHISDYDEKNRRGKWITVFFLIISIAVFIYGVYHALWGWTSPENNR